MPEQVLQTQVPAIGQSMEGKPEHEVAVDQFVEADRRYKAMEQALLTGEIVAEIARGVEQGQDPEWAKEQFQIAFQQLNNLREERNAKLVAVKVALRGLVQIGEGQWRGQDAKADSRKVGPFQVLSITSRSFNPESLFAGVERSNLMGELLQATKVNKDGDVVPLVKQEWEIDYEGTMDWLRARGLTAVIEAAYDEKEKTAQVRGAKPLAGLGQELKD